MVKNDAGGNKGKGLARKHVNAAKCGSTKQLRVATDAAERYAIVSKMLGNGMCYVRLLDGSTRDRLCIIRNKFKGRGKRDNILDSGSWVLVGMREWSSKQDTCDLLEVYNAAERDRLQKNEPVFKTVEVSSNTNASTNDGNNASTGTSNNTNTNSSSSSNSVQFADSTTMKYSSMLNKGTNSDADADADADVPMQQRVYDMPPNDSDQSDSDQSDSDQSDSEEDNEDSEEDNEDNEDSEDNRSSEDNEDEAEAEVQVLHKPNAKKAMNKCEINVDDI
jgi:initiation factor 1A